MPLVRGIFYVLTAVLLLTSCKKNQDILKPNLILISIDTLRADHLGCYGYDRPTSPIIDKLASEGVLFKDASATSPWTLPSHGSLLTSFYPSQIGLSSKRGKLPLGIETLATILSRYYFTTAAIVNSIYVSKRYGFDRGFDFFRYVPESYTTTGVAPIIIKHAIQWVQTHKNKQFFLFLHFYDVHSDYRSLPQYEREFVGSYHGIIDGSNNQLLKVRHGEITLDKADIKHLIDLYDAGIRQLDDQLKMLFDFLNKEALLEKTYLIITSDHGEEFLEHGYVLHSQTHYQEAIHIPLIIRGPGIPRSKRLKDVVSLVDVVPTSLRLLGIPKPSTLSGFDLGPLWQKNSYTLPNRCIFSEADKKNVKDNIKRIVRSEKYKFHHNLLTKSSELYNLDNDSKEHVNIVSKKPSIVDLLLVELKKFMQMSNSGKESVDLTPEEIEKLKRLGYL